MCPNEKEEVNISRGSKLVGTVLTKRICVLGFEAVVLRESYVRQICHCELEGGFKIHDMLLGQPR